MTEAAERVAQYAFEDLGWPLLYLTNAEANHAPHRIKEKQGAQLVVAGFSSPPPLDMISELLLTNPMGRPKRIETDELLKIARSVFVRDGAHGSTREIARVAGVSEAALFKRFPTKAELFLAAMMPPNVDVEALIAAAEAVDDPRESLVVLAGRMLDYFREAIPVILQLTANPLIDLEAVRRRFGVGPERRLAQAVPAYFARQAARGLIVCPDPGGAALLLISAVHSLALFEIMALHSAAQGPASVRAIVTALWEGLKPGAGAHA